MSGFADAIARLSNEHFETPLADEWTCAEAILAMPEMQAIRLALIGKADECPDGYTVADCLRDHYELPESVIGWVLEVNP